MHKLLLIILLLGIGFGLTAQSIHGSDFKMDCAACHTADSWEIPAQVWRFEENTPENQEGSALLFDHSNTNFPLTGQHTIVDCRDCHETLVFAEASPECISCHTDMHNQTVGDDCMRCHSPQHWLVDNITELHHDNGFPLLGVHASVSCTDCHISESELQFHRIGNDCINCHFDDYTATTNPNHNQAGFSSNCTDCHTIDGFDWSSENINHDFFPLTMGHDIADCTKCHTSGSFSNLPTECVACHQSDYENALNPDHQSGNFPTDCMLCHTTDIGWMPADFSRHDSDYFPIYSGKHEGEWNDCIECHTTLGNFAEFSCIDCHEHDNAGELANEHDEVSDYEYSSSACYACHPTGDE